MGIARSNLLCCFRTRRRAQAQQRHDGGGEDEANKTFLGATCACCAARFSQGGNARQLKMPTSRRWMRGMNRVFARSPPCGLTAVDADARVVEPKLQTVTTATAVQVGEEEEGRAGDHWFSRQQVAAATIQACFRGHLVRTLPCRSALVHLKTLGGSSINIQKLVRFRRGGRFAL